MYRRSLPNASRKDEYRPNRLASRIEETQRFSSFETPPGSEKGNEEFSDFETSREKNQNRNSGQHSLKKERSHILVEQLPLQYDKSASSRKKPNLNAYEELPRNGLKAQKYDRKALPSASSKTQSPKLKQNCSLKYNYMQKIEKQLSTIQQDTKEELRESALRAMHPPRAYPVTKFNALESIDDFQRSIGQRFYYESNLALLEKQNLQMLMLQQENISLKQRILLLEQQLRARDEEKVQRQAAIIAERMSVVTQQDYMNSTRKEAKLKLIEEVSVLQSRCREMKEQMKQYKQKQQGVFARMMKEKEEVKLENIMFKNTNEYQAKFTEVFLNMIEKLPIDLEPGWSKKRKIAVGWKVVKHFVKKALKLGIHPPSISQKQDIV